jgi:hypothetical protein
LVLVTKSIVIVVEIWGLIIFSSLLAIIYVYILYFYLIAGARPSSIKIDMLCCQIGSNNVQQPTQEQLKMNIYTVSSKNM